MRSARGSSLLELPMALYCLLIGLALPIIAYGTLFYRVYMFDCIVKSACEKGSKAADVASATTEINNYLSTATPNGVLVNTPIISTIKEPVSYTTASGAKSYNNWYLQVKATGEVNPLITLPGWLGLHVPGLTGALPLNCSAQKFFENQSALGP